MGFILFYTKVLCSEEVQVDVHVHVLHNYVMHHCMYVGIDQSELVTCR